MPLPRRASLPDPLDVLSGRARATLEQLFALIHAVNPTDRGLSAPVVAERYRLKARLQSLLIRLHGAHLEVVPDPGDAKVVSLRHRHGGRDACHALADALDADARAWVDAALLPDRPVVVPPSALRGPPPTLPSDPLAQGIAALELFDYEAARAAFTAALDASGGAVEPARLLLDLLVHHLADDEASLALMPGFSRATLEDAEVRGALALAAARLGDAKRARVLVRGARSGAAAEVTALLVALAIREHALSEAAQDLERLRALDPMHPDLPRLSRALADAHRSSRLPAEAALAAALAGGDRARAQAEAMALLARWPDSEAARAALRHLEEEERQTRVAALLDALDVSSDRDDPVASLARVRQARALGPLSPAQAARLDRAEDGARRGQDRAAAATVAALFAEDRLEAALRASLTLGAEGRAALSAAHDLPELRWLWTLGEERHIPVILALRQARVAMGGGDAAGAIAALGPHSKVARTLSEGRALLTQAETAVAVAAESRRRAEIEEVDAALQRGDLEAASLRVGALAPERRGQVLAAIEGARAERLRQARRTALLAADDLFGLRALALEAGDADEVAALTGQIRARSQARVLEAPDLDLHDWVIPNQQIHPRPWLSEDGATLVLASSLARHIFVRVLDADTLALRRAVQVRAPAPLQLHYAALDGDALSLVGRHGELLTLRCTDGEILRWRPRPLDLADDERVSESAILAPDGRYVWLLLGSLAGIELRVYDAERWPSFRRVEAGGAPVPLLGSTPLAVGRIDPHRGASLYDCAGRRLRARDLYPDMKLTRLALLPDGQPLVATADASDRPEVARARAAQTGQFPTEDPIAFARPGADATHSHLHIYGMSSVSQDHLLATALGERTVYLKTSVSGAAEITRIRADATGRLADHARSCFAPAPVLLLSDRCGRRVRALTYTADGLRRVALDGSEAVTQHEAAAEHYRGVVTLGGADGGTYCAFGPTWCSARAEAWAADFGPMLRRDRLTRMRRLQDEHKGDPDALLDLCAAAARVDLLVEAEALYNAVGADHTDHPRWRLLVAGVTAGKGAWDEVLIGLEGLTPEIFPEVPAQHLLHLRGVALLYQGDREAGVQTLREAVARGGPCELAVLKGLLDVMEGVVCAEPLTANEVLRRARVAALVGAILEADRALEGGLPTAAIAALDVTAVWRAHERQSLARLARAWLSAAAPRSDAEAWRRRYALASFLDLHQRRQRGEGFDLPIPPNLWSGECMEALAQEVTAALEKGWP